MSPTKDRSQFPYTSYVNINRFICHSSLLMLHHIVDNMWDLKVNTNHTKVFILPSIHRANNTPQPSYVNIHTVYQKPYHDPEESDQAPNPDHGKKWTIKTQTNIHAIIQTKNKNNPTE